MKADDLQPLEIQLNQGHDTKQGEANKTDAPTRRHDDDLAQQRQKEQDERVDIGTGDDGGKPTTVQENQLPKANPAD